MSAAAALARTAPLYERVRGVIPAMEWPVFAEDIDAILRLKRERTGSPRICVKTVGIFVMPTLSALCRKATCRLTWKWL